MTDDDFALPSFVSPGAVFRINHGKGNRNNRKYHVRGLVDGMAVVRSWQRRRQCWLYEVLDGMWFYYHLEQIEVCR